GQPIEVIAATGGQINFTVPPNVTGSNASLKVDCNGQQSDPITLPLQPAAPAIFTLSSTGTGEGSVLNPDFSINGPATPVAHNGYLAIYATGFGNYLDPGSDGLQRTVLDVQAFVGEKPAQVLFAGHAPTFTLGLQQINILIPPDAPSGPTV